MPSDESDATYARRVQEGDRSAFRVLIERYEGMVFDLAHQYADSSEDAEDLAQDAFLRAYRRIGDLKSPGRFSSWLYGIALNRCRDYAKNVRRETYAFSHTEDQMTLLEKHRGRTRNCLPTNGVSTCGRRSTSSRPRTQPRSFSSTGTG